MMVMSSRERRALVIGGSVLLLAAIVATTLVLTAGGSGSGLATPRVLPAAQPRFPGPPHGAVVYAREDGADALALAVVPREHGVGLQASVVDGDGAGVVGLRVSFRVTARDGVSTTPGTACGTGCYHASVNLETRPLDVRVRVARPGRQTTWNVRLPAAWRPASGSAIIARATRVWKGLRTLSYLDHLGSDQTHVLVTHWQAVAPDRLAYQIDAGSQAIIVGRTRWDRASGSASWQSSTAVRLHQPQPFWVSATDAHVLGSGRLAGHAVWHVSFYDPRTPAWFLVAIDKKTLRTLDLHMTATAHFMHDSYGPFNVPIKIVPPAS
jgi:hypothetical protein